MPTTIPTNNAIEAEVLAGHLRAEGIEDIEIVNASTVALGTEGSDFVAGVIVPDSAANRAQEIAEGGLELPEDAEFVDEDGREIQPEPFSPLLKGSIIVAAISLFVAIAAFALLIYLQKQVSG